MQPVVWAVFTISLLLAVPLPCPRSTCSLGIHSSTAEDRGVDHEIRGLDLGDRVVLGRSSRRLAHLRGRRLQVPALRVVLASIRRSSPGRTGWGEGAVGISPMFAIFESPWSRPSNWRPGGTACLRETFAVEPAGTEAVLRAGSKQPSRAVAPSAPAGRSSCCRSTRPAGSWTPPLDDAMRRRHTGHSRRVPQARATYRGRRVSRPAAADESRLGVEAGCPASPGASGRSSVPRVAVGDPGTRRPPAP